jgi:hypothetical protein
VTRPDAPEGLAELLVATIDWSSYRKVGGDRADSVGAALVEFLRAGRDAVEGIRNRLETEVAVQANLYSASVPAMRVLAAALVEERPRWVRIATLDLMFLILSGASAPEETAAGETTLRDRCVAAARESLWSIVRVAKEDPVCLGAVLDVLQVIDPEGSSARVLGPRSGS